MFRYWMNRSAKYFVAVCNVYKIVIVLSFLLISNSQILVNVSLLAQSGFCLYVLVVLPLWDYLRIPNSGNAGKLAGLFITLWLFTALGPSLESFYFRRADPVWFCMLIAVIGLRLTAHMTLQHTDAQIDR